MALKVTVTWTAVTTYEDGEPLEEGTVVKYSVFRGMKPDLSDGAQLADVAETTYIDSDVTPNKTYYYGVQAYIVESLPSTMSDIDSVRTFPPGKPQSVEGVVSKEQR